MVVFLRLPSGAFWLVLDAMQDYCSTEKLGALTPAVEAAENQRSSCASVQYCKLSRCWSPRTASLILPAYSPRVAGRATGASSSDGQLQFRCWNVEAFGRITKTTALAKAMHLAARSSADRGAPCILTAAGSRPTTRQSLCLKEAWHLHM